MRIVYCLPEISHPGGIGRITSIKANYLVDHGHEVYIVTTDQNNLSVFYELDERVNIKDFGLNFYITRQSKLYKRIVSKLTLMHKYKKELSGFLFDVKADIVVSTFTNESSFLYKIEDGSKKVLEYHFCHDSYKSIHKYGNVSLTKRFFDYIKLKKQEFIAHKYDAFCVLTKEDAKSWKGFSNLHVIPNMLSFDSVDVSDCYSKRVLAVGRLDFQKKFDRLLNIWNEVHKTYPDWRLDIFGQGPDKAMLLQLISNNGLDDCVQLNEPSCNIKEEYLKSSILAMTSTYEGWGLVLTEAMSCGVPCVAYACKCGPKDIIQDNYNGFCVPEGDSLSFIKALKRLIDDSQLRKQMGANAKKSSENYLSDVIMPKWIELFERLVQKN